jgi:hypothetical protein
LRGAFCNGDGQSVQFGAPLALAECVTNDEAVAAGRKAHREGALRWRHRRKDQKLKLTPTTPAHSRRKL